jgi:hypothetical protein
MSDDVGEDTDEDEMDELELLLLLLSNNKSCCMSMLGNLNRLSRPASTDLIIPFNKESFRIDGNL